MPFSSYEFENEVNTDFLNVISQLIIDVKEPQKFIDVTHIDTRTRCLLRPPTASASTLRFAFSTHETSHCMLITTKGSVCNFLSFFFNYCAT